MRVDQMRKGEATVVVEKGEAPVDPGTEDARHMGMGIAAKGREPAWFQNLTLEEKEEMAELLEGGGVAVGQGLRAAVMESGVEGV